MTFLKKLTVLLVLLNTLPFQKGIAQDATDISFEGYYNPTFAFNAVEFQFKKPLTYLYRYSIQPKFCPRPEAVNLFDSGVEVYLNFKGKWENDKTKAEYFFEMQTNGLDSFVKLKDEAAKRQIPPPPGSTAFPTEYTVYTRVFKAYFPYSIVISKGLGDQKKVIKTIIMNDGTTPQYVTLSTRMDGTTFPSFADIDRVGKEEIAYNLERQFFRSYGLQFRGLLNNLYENSSFKDKLWYGFIKKKNRKFDYSDFDKALDLLKSGYKALSKGDAKEGEPMIAEAAKAFESLTKSTEPRITAQVKLVSQVNLAWCYFWQNKGKETYTLFKEIEDDLKKADATTYSYLASKATVLEKRRLLKENAEKVNLSALNLDL